MTGTEGPDLASLVRRLSKTPGDFLRPPRVREVGEVKVGAVVHDLLEDLDPGATVEPKLFEVGVTNELRLVLLTSWLLHDDWFLNAAKITGKKVLSLLTGLGALAKLVDASLFVTDADRREELVRYVLEQLAHRPQGESKTQAKDRLAALDSVERARVIEKSKKAAQRAKKIREELKKKAEEAAAAKVSRE